MVDANKFKKETGIEISDAKVLNRAMTHRSSLGESSKPDASNERLEFLGDAVLEYIVSKKLFKKFPDEEEGQLTKLRAALVRRTTLAKIATTLKLGEFLIMGRGEETSGGRTKEYILANSVEAIIGAIYLDKGLEAAEAFIEKEIFVNLDEIIKEKLYTDAKTQLQEYVQAKRRVTPKYKTLQSTGPDHNRKFTVAVTIRKKKFKTGAGRTKQAAQEQAAEKTLKHLHKFGF